MMTPMADLAVAPGVAAPIVMVAPPVGAMVVGGATVVRVILGDGDAACGEQRRAERGGEDAVHASFPV